MHFWKASDLFFLSIEILFPADGALKNNIPGPKTTYFTPQNLTSFIEIEFTRFANYIQARNESFYGD